YKPSAKLSEEEKKEAVIDLCSREGQAREAAKKYGVTRAALYRWKSQLLGSGSPVKRRSANGGPQSSRDTNELESEVESLRKQVEDLRSEVHRLQLERDVLAATAAILKKEGADPAALSNREKSLITSALLGKYRLRDLLRSLGLAKSSYFYQKAAMAAPDNLPPSVNGFALRSLNPNAATDTGEFMPFSGKTASPLAGLAPAGRSSGTGPFHVQESLYRGQCRLRRLLWTHQE